MVTNLSALVSWRMFVVTNLSSLVSWRMFVVTNLSSLVSWRMFVVTNLSSLVSWRIFVVTNLSSLVSWRMFVVTNLSSLVSWQMFVVTNLSSLVSWRMSAVTNFGCCEVLYILNLNFVIYHHYRGCNIVYCEGTSTIFHRKYLWNHNTVNYTRLILYTVKVYLRLLPFRILIFAEVQKSTKAYHNY